RRKSTASRTSGGRWRRTPSTSSCAGRRSWRSFSIRKPSFLSCLGNHLVRHLQGMEGNPTMGWGFFCPPVQVHHGTQSHPATLLPLQEGLLRHLPRQDSLPGERRVV